MAEKNNQVQNGSNAPASVKHVCEVTGCVRHIEHISQPKRKNPDGSKTPVTFKYRIHFKSYDEMMMCAAKFVAWDVNQSFQKSSLPAEMVPDGPIADIYSDLTIAETEAMRDAWLASLNADEKEQLERKLRAELERLLAKK